jgi:hypothetical protein
MRKLLATSAAALAMLSGTAEAACKLANLAGSWRLQLTGSLEDLTLLRADCRLTFNRTGRLTNMTCFEDRNIAMFHLLDRSLEWEQNTFPAQVGRNCWFKLTLRNLHDTEGVWLDGHMTADKGAILGSGELFDNFGLVQFSMVRQSGG